MNLHFIFLIKQEDLKSRTIEFEYIKEMAAFFGFWTHKIFDVQFDVYSDIMVSAPRGLLQRADTHLLLQDHEQRGNDIYHFYLTYFRPLWTDCTCEGYHAENFGMVWWQRPARGDDIPFMAQTNCPVVSHILTHELLRQRGVRKYIPIVHDVWTEHLFADLPFVGYDADYRQVKSNPRFLTMDTSSLL